MIEFKKRTLANGLQVVVSEDHTTPMVSLNVMYLAGARNENPLKTGYAHMLEHCMFTGTESVPNYDELLQRCGATNNAYTTNDVTNYYITIPSDNVEVAFYIERDRMMNLAFFEEGFQTQRSVVMEEMKQRCLNAPYGDIQELMRGMIYKVHPYRWSTIGLSLQTLADAKIDDLRSFYESNYAPDNAILSICGNVNADEMFDMAQKYFGGISRRSKRCVIPQEPEQMERRIVDVVRNVPASAVVLAYHSGNAVSRDAYVGDLATDLLAAGESSLLNVNLVRNKGVCSQADAIVNNSFDPGFLYLVAFAKDGLPLESVADSLREEALRLTDLDNLSEYDFQKVKNKAEYEKVMDQIKCSDKATNLAMATALGDTNLINTDFEKFASVTLEEVAEYIKRTIVENNESILYYRKQE